MPAVSLKSSAEVVSSLRDLRDRANRNGEGDAALRINDAIQLVKNAASVSVDAQRGMRLVQEIAETEQSLRDAVQIQFPAYDPPRLQSSLVTIHCDRSTPLVPVVEFTYENESQLGEVGSDARLRFELQTVSVPNGEAVYSVTLLEEDENPRLTLREAGLVSR